MRSASAEPCGTSPGVRFGNAAQTLHSICPTAPLRRRPKRHHMQGALQPPPLHGSQQRGQPQCNAPGHSCAQTGQRHDHQSHGDHCTPCQGVGPVRSRHGAGHTQSDQGLGHHIGCVQRRAPGTVTQRLAALPSFLPPRSCRAGLPDGTWLATTSAAANRGRDAPNTGRITAPASTPPPSCPAADQGWNCRLSKKYLRR